MFLRPVTATAAPKLGCARELLAAAAAAARTLTIAPVMDML